MISVFVLPSIVDPGQEEWCGEEERQGEEDERRRGGREGAREEDGGTEKADSSLIH